MHFTNRGIMPIVDAQQKQRVMDIADDLIRLIKDNSFEQNLTGNVWLEDKITDSYQAEARELLQYEEDLVGHFKNTDLQSSEDPILRAHAHISNKRRSERPMVCAFNLKTISNLAFYLFISITTFRLLLRSQHDTSNARDSKFSLTFKNYWKKIPLMSPSTLISRPESPRLQSWLILKIMFAQLLLKHRLLYLQLKFSWIPTCLKTL